MFGSASSAAVLTPEDQECVFKVHLSTIFVYFAFTKRPRGKFNGSSLAEDRKRPKCAPALVFPLRCAAFPDNVGRGAQDEELPAASRGSLLSHQMCPVAQAALRERSFVPLPNQVGHSHPTFIPAQAQSEKSPASRHVLWKLRVLWPCLLTAKHWKLLTGNHAWNILSSRGPVWWEASPFLTLICFASLTSRASGIACSVE